jgi:hypothetical protein
VASARVVPAFMAQSNWPRSVLPMQLSRASSRMEVRMRATCSSVGTWSSGRVARFSAMASSR